MCVVSRSECGSIGEMGTRAKPLCLSQPVGLLALLVDPGSAPLPVCGNQKLFRHVSYSRSGVCLSHLVSDSAQIPESSLTSRMPCPEKKVSLRIMKKVRFAPDVVEPSGDSRTYRGRKDANQVTQKKAYEERQGDVESVRKDDDLSSSCKSSCHDHNCRKVARPNLPANRMLLYKGMQCYKAKMMPCL